jgi:hypothetical protein
MTPPFNVGDRIRLIAMPNDPCPIPAGETGTVVHPPVWFQRSWQITVKWDSGRALGLVVPPDVAEVIA